MTEDFVRYIVRCVQSFTDGNCDPKTVKIGAVIDITKAQWLRLKQSGPDNFELLDMRVPNPYREEAVQEVVEEPEIEDWKPVPWYAAQLARAATDD